ncbi:hypothetical protein [Amycolatopsis sacchari]|uniref:hypothetical protein n=1 Tax=Amycolatopsis sacchari TaxID=115433 RepID=UPI001FEBB3E4|nr:hypothetical protein [Amycolatopsis sacchari]
MIPHGVDPGPAEQVLLAVEITSKCTAWRDRSKRRAYEPITIGAPFDVVLDTARF